MSQNLGSKKIKIWFAIGTPYQANLFHPVIEKLKDRVEILVTAREHDRILEILDAKGVGYKVVGKHGGSTLYGKLSAYAETLSGFVQLINAEKPNLMLTERWPEAVRTAFGLNIPSWTLFYDEREFHVNRMVFPLSNKVFAPSFYTPKELREHGVLEEASIVWFKGFHTTYLKGYRPSGKDPFKEMGVSHPLVLVRTEPRFASFFPGEKPVLEEAVKMLVGSTDYRRGRFSMVAVPRDENQRERFERMGVPIFNAATPDNPVFFADVVLGAAETMLMEAFVLSKPCVSGIYWQESKPVKELHKHVPHSKDPKELCSETLRLINPEEAESFKKRARRMVDLMDNITEKIEREILLFLGEKVSAKKYRLRRSELDLCMELIEEVSLSPSKLTPLMYNMGVSYNKLRALVKKLVNKGLLMETIVDGDKYYRATDQGVELLFNYKRIRSVLD
jgi:predicted glycosyltransferase/predicted transcriptional regulator